MTVVLPEAKSVKVAVGGGDGVAVAVRFNLIAVQSDAIERFFSRGRQRHRSLRCRIESDDIVFPCHKFDRLVGMGPDELYHRRVVDGDSQSGRAHVFGSRGADSECLVFGEVRVKVDILKPVGGLDAVEPAYLFVVVICVDKGDVGEDDTLFGCHAKIFRRAHID